MKFLVVAVIAFLAFAPDLQAEQSAQVAGSGVEQKLERARRLVSEREDSKSREEHSNVSADSGPQTPSVLRMLEALGICVGFFLVGAHFLKRINGKHGSGSSKRMRVLERLPVSPKTTMVLAQVDGKTILFSVGAERVTAVSLETDEAIINLPMELVCQEDKHASAA
jgi:flagellar biogenesis protein FliO